MRTQCDVDSRFGTTVRKLAAERAALKLSRFGDVIRDVRIALKDTNGPKGGVDVQCVVWIRLERAPEVIIHHVGASAGEALACALDRATRIVAREVDKKATRFQYRRRRSQRNFQEMEMLADRMLDTDIS